MMDAYDGRELPWEEDANDAPPSCGCSSEKPQIGAYKFGETEAYIKDFKIKSFDKRLASIERRITDLEYALMKEGKGVTGLVDREAKLIALDKRLFDLEDAFRKYKAANAKEAKQ